MPARIFYKMDGPAAPHTMQQPKRFMRSAKSLAELHHLVLQKYLGISADSTRAHESIKELGTDAMRIALMMLAEVKIIQRAEANVKDGKIDPPTAFDERLTSMTTVSGQVPMYKLPKEVQGEIRRLFFRTYSDNPNGEPNEYASFAIRLPNGRFIFPCGEFGITSRNSAQVEQDLHTSLSPFFHEIRQMVKKGNTDGDIVVYALHTHPQTLEHPNGAMVNKDGLYYTHLSRIDHASARQTLEYIEATLNSLGYIGRSRVIGSAIPVPLRPLDNLPGQLYISSYFLDAELKKEYI